MRSTATIVALALLLPAAGATTAEAFEWGAKNAPGQTPASADQTRAPQPASAPDIEARPVAEGLPKLWSMEFLPDGRMLVATKAGAMHIVDRDGEPGPALQGVPEVMSRGQGGLLDIALAPDFAQSGTIYFSYAEPRGAEGNGTSVASATLAVDAGSAGRLDDVRVIFRQTPSYRGNKHFGSRLAFAPDGTLFVTVGERSDTPIRDQAQDLSSGLGKVFRIAVDGSAPQDNPFVGQSGALAEIYSYGHRNLQSAVVTEAGTLWTVEHGPRGGDELNRPEPGKNYGWPVITYGINYNGTEVGNGRTAAEGMEQPVYYWDPVIAPSGMAEYDASLIPEWEGALLIGGLVSRSVVVLEVEDGRVVAESRVPVGERVRDVKVGPDGAVYAVTETRGASGTSSIVRLAPAGAT